MRALLLVSAGLLAVSWTGPGWADDAPAKPAWAGEFDGDWAKHWNVHKPKKWGMDNLTVGTEAGGRFPTFLRAAYPAGSASPTVTRTDKVPVGGGQFFADLGLKPCDHLHLRYHVRFAKGFDFVKGGKLPGLFGGSVGTGGHIPDGENGFTTRGMWRKNGAGEIYAYTPASVGHGTSLGRGNWRFIPGTWHAIEQEVVLNTPGKADGRVRVWFDEKPVLDQKGLTFRTVDTLKIEGILFSTFFGGDDTSWATPKDTNADFAGFAVGDSYLGPAPAGK